MNSFFTFIFNMWKGGIQIGNFNISSEDINYFIKTTVKLLVIIIFMYLFVKLGSYIIDKTVKKQNNMRFSIDEKKAWTLGAVLKSVLRYVVYFFGIGAILTTLFGTISLTFASIGGVAIGFGSQSLVKDVINGIFILFEDQFAVGDLITIDSKTGTVESIELRITKLRDPSGDLHMIPNGLITKVTNHSRGDMRIMVDVVIAHEVDVDKTIVTLEALCRKFSEENENVVDGPKVAGVVNINDTSVTIRVVGKAKSMTQWDTENRLRKEIKVVLDKANIEMPYQRRKIIN